MFCFQFFLKEKGEKENKMLRRMEITKNVA